MRDYIDPAIARIMRGAQPVGAGCLVRGRLLVTCAHVVRDALGLKQAPEVRPTDPIGKIGGALNGAIKEAMADQAEVEIALKIKGCGDIKLVSAMAEYDMKVKLTWKYPRPTATES